MMGETEDAGMGGQRMPPRVPPASPMAATAGVAEGQAEDGRTGPSDFSGRRAGGSRLRNEAPFFQKRCRGKIDQKLPRNLEMPRPDITWNHVFSNF